MTVGTHIAEILRQGVWASLTGGWYYEPAHSAFCNTIHLYLWIVLLVLPLLLGLISTGTLSTGLLLTYVAFICFLFIVIKLIVAYLHRVFDTTEPVIVTKKAEEKLPSSERLSSTAAVQGSRNGDQQSFEMVEMTEIRTASSSPRPESRRRVSEVSSRSGDGGARRRNHRVRIIHTEPDPGLHHVDVNVHVDTPLESVEPNVDDSELAVVTEADPESEQLPREDSALLPKKKRFSKRASSSLEDLRANRLTRKMSEPVFAAYLMEVDRRNSDGTTTMSSVRRVASTAASANTTGGSMLSQHTLAQCKHNTHKSYPTKMSSTDDFLNKGTLKKSEARADSSSTSIKFEFPTKELEEEQQETGKVEDEERMREVEADLEVERTNQMIQPEPSQSVPIIDEPDDESEDEEEEEEEHEEDEPQPSTSKVVEMPPGTAPTSAWTPVVVSFAPSSDSDRPTASLHRAKERIAQQDDLPGTSSDGTADLKNEITRFLEDLIDKHPETLDAIESVRQSRLSRNRQVPSRSHTTHPHVARWSGSRRAQQTAAMCALSDLALRDGTHIASGHEDTTQGAIHSFQDEDGNWWTYAFDENGVGTAQALGSGAALMDLIGSATTAPVPNKRLEALHESPLNSSEEEEHHDVESAETGTARKSTDGTSRSTTHRFRPTTRSRAASSSSNDSQVYIGPIPSNVFHAPTQSVATRSSSQPRSAQSSQSHVISMAASRLRSAFHGDRDRERREERHERERSEAHREQLVDRPFGLQRDDMYGRGADRVIFDINQRLRQLSRLDSTHSAGSASSRFRFLADLGLAGPHMNIPSHSLPLDSAHFLTSHIRRASSAKKAYYYQLKLLPKSERSFRLKLDRISVSNLFDRPRSISSAILDIMLAVIVSLLATVVISKAIYHDISLVAFAFVVAGAHFSLLKSVQPDAASPIHGFNWLVAYSRPIYFCILCAILLWLDLAAGETRNEEIPWNWNLYRWPTTSAGLLVSIRDLVATVILLLPIAFTFGWLPQVNTLTLHILEQVQMHVFGGTACTSVTSALIQISLSLIIWALLSVGTYFARQHDSNSTQTIVFSALSSATVALSFLLSRLPSNPQFLLLALSPLRCKLPNGNGNARENHGDEESLDSGTRLLCTSKPKREEPAREAIRDEWTGASSTCTPSTPQDPLPKLLSQTLSLRTRHDLLFALLTSLFVFALHSTSLFTATKPYFTISITCVAIFVGSFNHYLYMQLRIHNPWKLVAKPILRSAEFGQFESTEMARLMWFEVIHVWAGALERNVIYPLLVVGTMTEFGWRLPYPVLFLPLFAIKILRTGYSAPQSLFVPLALSFLLTRFDWVFTAPIPLFTNMTSSIDLFPIMLYFLVLIYPKWLELYLKLSFVLAYVAPWQISWGSAFHAFAQPFSVPHSGLVCVQTILSSIISAPLNPFLGSSFFLTSYVRPVKFWERDYNTKRSDASNTRLAAQIDRGPMMDDSNLNAVFYEHLTRSLQASLAGDIRLGRWASTVHPGDCFILASFYLNCLVHIIEVGNGFVTFQLRGLEFRGTYCHQREVEAISEDSSEGTGCCCCSPGSLPGFLSLNTAWTLRWLAWEVTSSKYIIDGYSITDNSAVNLLQVHELRRLLVTLYVKCIVYFSLKSPRLSSWLANETIQAALHPIESNPRYVDVDHMFCSANDEDYDVNNMGISRQSFSDLYSPWIDFCLKKRVEAESDGICNDISVLPLCFALSLLGRRALGAAAYNRHSNAAESFLYGLHALFKGDFRVTCQRDEWVFADVELLRCVIAPAVRMALKLHQDHFAAADDFDDGDGMFTLMSQHERHLFISHEHDPGWRQAILANTPSLLALRHIYDDGQDDYKIIMLNKMHLNMRVIKLNRECVRAFWAGQQQELIFLRNRNPERGSIQNARQVLRNMINSSADQPVGYPIYVSPLTTSFVETHPQIRQVQGPPLTVQGISSFLGRLWEGLRSHFGTSGSSSLAPAQSCGGTSGPAPVGPHAPPPSSAPSLRPLNLSQRDSGDQDRLSSGSSQPEQSVVSMCADGSAKGHGGESPEGNESDASDAEEDTALYVEIVNSEEIFKCLNEPLKATGEPLVFWPKEAWRLVGGRACWVAMPSEGMAGRVVHSWLPNHPQRALRSHIGDTIHLVSLFEMPSAVVPISERGIRVLTKGEAIMRARATQSVSQETSLQTLQEALVSIVEDEMTSHGGHQMGESGFVEPEDGFADDDLLSPDDLSVNLDGIPHSRSFLEREDFESELGSVDPFAEDFSEIAKHDIVELVADGDRVARPIIVVYAYRLPSNKSFDHAKFLRFLQATLDKVVELDYTIVYFHYGLRSHNKPPIKWLFQAYKVLDRKYKKNLKALYVVHPTRFIRIIWGLFKPFISNKFEDKLNYVNCVGDLEKALAVTRLNLPEPVRTHDESVFPSSASASNRPPTPPTPPRPTQQFNVSLDFILSHHPDDEVPPIVSQLISYLEAHCLKVEGIFRKSANVAAIRRLQDKINKGEKVDFLNDADYVTDQYTAAIHASVLLKTFLSGKSLGEPVTTNKLYPELMKLADVPKQKKSEAVSEFVKLLPRPNFLLLKTVCRFLTKVSSHHQENLMTANNLSVVFGPNLTWPTDQQVPITQLNNLNNFCYKLIVDYEKIFGEKP
ncbi:unnamed protein product, partial [Mesorhabditis belari]|uniref:Pecanex-like protein n=1 Tax=Mesorhabditis belari TaxID=2138241 RepID=A0AAF3EY92_9BILA